MNLDRTAAERLRVYLVPSSKHKTTLEEEEEEALSLLSSSESSPRTPSIFSYFGGSVDIACPARRMDRLNLVSAFYTGVLLVS